MPELTLAAIAELVDGTLVGDGARTVHAVAPLPEATERDLSFVANARYAAYLVGARAGGVLIAEELAERVPEGLAHVRVADPHAALARVLPVLYPEPRPEPGVHPTAQVSLEAELAPDAHVGAYAVIGAGARIGPRSVVHAHAVVGAGCILGAECTLHAHAVVYPGSRLGDRVTVHSGARVGKPGFGFAWDGERHRRIPQVGGCVLEDEVEVGANATIDRGSVGDTVIGAGTKIDNLVQIGHNVRIGRNAIVISQVGVSGSVQIGDGAVLAGQAGVAGHLSIGAGARVAAQAGVIGDVEPGQTVSGYPARPHKEALRASASLFRLPELLKRLRRLERAVFGSNENS